MLHLRVDVSIGTVQHVPRGTELTVIAQTLAARVNQARSLEAVLKKDLQPGDRVLVTTRNSLYKIWVIAEGVYSVSGGWFDRQGTSPQCMGINGCTWGGSAIKQDTVAAPGLRLEFGNRVLTTPIRHVRLIRPSRAQYLGTRDQQFEGTYKLMKADQEQKEFEVAAVLSVTLRG